MSLVRTAAAASLALAGILALTGCATQPRYVAVGPPPPPVYGPAPIVQLAERNGFAAGQHDGARDLIQRAAYRPQYDRRYATTPGYDGRLGPYPVYRDAYRASFLRGYNNGFRRAEGAY
ncbi:MAG: hypothetical protein V4734_09685 [Terriglobus sp.]